MSKNKHDAFRYEFTPKEFFYFIFKRKVCPVCTHPLTKEKMYQTKDGLELPARSVLNHNTDIKCYYYRFTCEKCKHSYTLTELANM